MNVYDQEQEYESAWATIIDEFVASDFITRDEAETWVHSFEQYEGPEYGHFHPRWEAFDRWLFRVAVGLGIALVALVIARWPR